MNLEQIILELTEVHRLNTIKYLTEVKVEVLEFYKNGINDQLTSEGFNLFDLTRRSSEAYQRKNEIIKKFGEQKYQLGIQLFHENIEKLVNKDFEAKRKKLFVQITKKLENSIIENVNIFENNQGGFDASILLNDARIHITTIIASGWVQKPHLRTLIKRVKLL